MLFNKLRRAFAPSPPQPGPGGAEPRPDRRSVLGLSMVKSEQDIIEPFIRHRCGSTAPTGPTAPLEGYGAGSGPRGGRHDVP